MKRGNPSARPIRVYLVDMDRLPRTILTSLLESEGEIEVILDDNTAEAGDDPRTVGQLIERLEKRKPDVVIAGAEDSRRLEALVALLQTRVLLLADRGKRIYCSQLHPLSRVMGEISPDEFLSLIRDEDLDTTDNTGRARKGRRQA